MLTTNEMGTGVGGGVGVSPMLTTNDMGTGGGGGVSPMLTTNKMGTGGGLSNVDN